MDSSVKKHDGEVEIYEFSKGCTCAEKDGEWSFTGYAGDIDRSNYINGRVEEIPREIKNSIENQAFAFQSGLAPQPKEIALIGRVVERRYCVLAVANAYFDKRSPVSMYRYFWLDTESDAHQGYEGMDGLLTLLDWFVKNEEKPYNMDPSSFDKNKKLKCTQWFERDPRIPNTSLSTTYPVKPELRIANYDKIDEVYNVHELAVKVNLDYGLPISWAWNTKALANIFDFSHIFFEQKQYQILSNKILTDASKQHIKAVKDKGTCTPSTSDLDTCIELKKALKKFRENKHNDDEEIVRLTRNILLAKFNLEEDPNYPEDHRYEKTKQVFTAVKRQGVYNTPGYLLLEPIFFPEHLSSWVGELEKSNFSYDFNVSQIISVEENGNQGSEPLIKKQVYEGISIMLSYLLIQEVDIEMMDLTPQEKEETNLAIPLFEEILTNRPKLPWNQYLAEYSNEFTNAIKSNNASFARGETQRILSEERHYEAAKQLKEILTQIEKKKRKNILNIFSKNKGTEKLQDALGNLTDLLQKEVTSTSTLTVTSAMNATHPQKKPFLVYKVIMVLLSVVGTLSVFEKLLSSLPRILSSSPNCPLTSNDNLEKSMNDYKGNPTLPKRLTIHQELLNELQVYSLLNSDSTKRCNIEERKAYQYIYKRFLKQSSNSSSNEKESHAIVVKIMTYLAKAVVDNDDHYQSAVKNIEKCSQELKCIETKIINRS